MRSKRWGPASNDLEGLLFDGAPALLSQLDELVLRPRRWWRETLLPVIYLVCEPTARNPLDGLADRLHQARGVLHSRINGQESPLADKGQPSENSSSSTTCHRLQALPGDRTVVERVIMSASSTFTKSYSMTRRARVPEMEFQFWGMTR